MFCCELKNVILEKMAEESENENCSKEVRIQQLLLGVPWELFGRLGALPKSLKNHSFLQYFRAWGESGELLGSSWQPWRAPWTVRRGSR